MKYIIEFKTSKFHMFRGFKPLNSTRRLNAARLIALHMFSAPIVMIIIISIRKKGWQFKAGRERLTTYQSVDLSPKIPTHRMKEKKGKAVGDKKRASS